MSHEQNELSPQPENSNNPRERFPFVRKIREGAITLAQKAVEIPTNLIPKAAMPLLAGSAISIAVDEGLVLYSAIERSLDLSRYALANLMLGDISLIAASANLYTSEEQDTKIDRLSRVASLAEIAMAIGGSYMLRTGNYEDGIRIAFGTMILTTGHMLVNLVRPVNQSYNYKYSPRYN